VSRGDVYRVPICANGDVEHKHSRSCLPTLKKALPEAPAGWKWNYGHAGLGYALWLERVEGFGARWHVLGLPSATTLGGLAVLVDAFIAGFRGPLDGPN